MPWRSSQHLKHVEGQLRDIEVKLLERLFLVCEDRRDKYGVHGKYAGILPLALIIWNTDIDRSERTSAPRSLKVG